MFPITESETVFGRSTCGAGLILVESVESIWSRLTTEIEDERHENQTDNRDDFDTGEDELGFSIDSHGEDVQADDNDNDDRDPCSRIDLRVPETNNDGGSGNFGAESDGTRVPVVPALKTLEY
jgi:hypothetical protein